MAASTHVFVAKDSPMGARKRWISGSIHPAGSITVDDGAVTALAGGKSLLPAGVVAVEGDFARGDAVVIKDMAGRVLGKGLIAYDTADAKTHFGQKDTGN
jgi:glutamate 5-kinase